jgi:hypothetical protein
VAADACGSADDRAGYEARIDATGEVPTRVEGRGARHDLYNALAWLAWPRTKGRLNALHALGLATHAGGGRGGLRDALTLVDENAAAWVGLDASLEAALRAFDWPRLFVRERARLRASVAVHVLGHALLEKLDAPFKAVTAHAWPLRLPVDARSRRSTPRSPTRWGRARRPARCARCRSWACRNGATRTATPRSTMTRPSSVPAAGARPIHPADPFPPCCSAASRTTSPARPTSRTR